MKTPTTEKEILADKRVDSIERQTHCDDYNVTIYLADGFIADDHTSTLYGRTLRAAAAGLKHVTEGEPD